MKSVRTEIRDSYRSNDPAVVLRGKELAKQRRRDLRAAGGCTKCGEAVGGPKLAKCAACRKQNREHQMRSRVARGLVPPTRTQRCGHCYAPGHNALTCPELT